MSKGDEVDVGRKSGNISAEARLTEEEVAIPDYVMLDFIDDVALPDKRGGIERGAEPYTSPDLLG